MRSSAVSGPAPEVSRLGAQPPGQVRAPVHCGRCRRLVWLTEAQVAELAFHLEMTVPCPGCGASFPISVRPGAPAVGKTPVPPPPVNRHPMPPAADGGGASPRPIPPARREQAPRKAPPPFQSLLEPNCPAGAEAAAPCPAGAGGGWSLNDWWKRRSNRQQYAILAGLIVLMTVVIFGWTSHRGAPEPAAERPAAPEAGPAEAKTAPSPTAATSTNAPAPPVTTAPSPQPPGSPSQSLAPTDGRPATPAPTATVPAPPTSPPVVSELDPPQPDSDDVPPKKLAPVYAKPGRALSTFYPFEAPRETQPDLPSSRADALAALRGTSFFTKPPQATYPPPLPRGTPRPTLSRSDRGPLSRGIVKGPPPNPGGRLPGTAPTNPFQP